MRRLASLLAAVALIALAPPGSLQAQDTSIVTGEVKQVDLHAGQIIIRHGPIKNLAIEAPDTTDAFKVADAIMFNALRPGDRIKFTADRIDGRLTITAIRP
jgi:Cu(I)/Ag(I) efflux system periplasmic protein CusF